MLSLSDRQIRRLVKRVRDEGDTGISSSIQRQRVGQEIAYGYKDKVVKLYREKYSGFGPTLASEKLAELEEIQLSDETVTDVAA